MPRTKPYASSRFVETVRILLLFVGVVALIVGPVYAVNAATTGIAEVPVQLSSDVWDHVPIAPETVSASLPNDNNLLFADSDDVMLQSHLRTAQVADGRALAFLSRAQYLVAGLAVGVVAFLLAPVLGCIAMGRPFGAGTPRRLAWVAVVVAAAGLLATELPRIASGMVLQRMEISPADGLSAPDFALPLDSFVWAAALLLLAEVFRRGALIERETEGMV